MARKHWHRRAKTKWKLEWIKPNRVIWCNGSVFMIHSIDKLRKKFSFFRVVVVVVVGIDFITYFHWFQQTSNNSSVEAALHTIYYYRHSFILYFHSLAQIHELLERTKQKNKIPWKENFRFIGYKWMFYNWAGKLDSNQCEMYINKHWNGGERKKIYEKTFE